MKKFGPIWKKKWAWRDENGTPYVHPALGIITIAASCVAIYFILKVIV